MRNIPLEIPALVLGGGFTGLGAVRSLGRAGVPVHFVDDQKTEAIHSKYCKKYCVSPEINHNNDKLKKILSDLQNIIGNVVLFPSSDLYVMQLSNLIENLHGFYTPFPKKEVIQILINKRKFYETLMTYEVPHPTTSFPENIEDVLMIQEKTSYPVFIKPYYSHLFSKKFQKKRFHSTIKKTIA